MNEYPHGGDIYGYAEPPLDFSSNVNPLGLPDTVKAALAASIPDWARYPDPFCRELRKAIAGRENLPEEWILCGAGAAELLFFIAQALRPRCTLLPVPSFAEYERAVQASGGEIAYVTLFEKDGFNLTDKILGRMDPAQKLMILCNPNNPTGQTVDRELFQRILKKSAANHTTLLVDECFVPFLQSPDAYTLRGSLKDYPNLILLKAFTKQYAMAGLRLGYLLCSDPEMLSNIGRCIPPWNVSAPAQTAGIAALRDVDYQNRTRELINTERASLTAGLQKLGLTVIGSQANYIFFKCNTHKDLKERLLERQILIRSCANFKGLDQRFYRVAVRTRAENARLLSALTAELKEG